MQYIYRGSVGNSSKIIYGPKDTLNITGIKINRVNNVINLFCFVFNTI